MELNISIALLNKLDLDCHVLKAKNMTFFEGAELNRTIFKTSLKILHYTQVGIAKNCKISAS